MICGMIFSMKAELAIDSILKIKQLKTVIMKQILILTVFVFAFRLAEAQYIQPGQEKPNIEVVGVGELEIVPNEIYISFTFK
jgi:hypothetical protein